MKKYLSAATLALGAIIAGVYFTSEEVNLETNRAYLEYRGITKEDGVLMQEWMQEFDMPNNVTSHSVSFVTYDSSAPSYNPKDSSTWTQDIWVGLFNVEVSTSDLLAMDVINAIYEGLRESFPAYEAYDRKPVEVTE